MITYMDMKGFVPRFSRDNNEYFNDSVKVRPIVFRVSGSASNI